LSHPFRPDAADEAALAELRERLALAGFDEAGVADRLGIDHPIDITLDHFPEYEERVRAAEDALDVAVALFVLQGSVARRDAEALLGRAIVKRLVEAGALVSPGRGRVAATVAVSPCAGCLFVTDLRFPELAPAVPAPDEPVMYLSADSYALAYLVPGTGAEARVLDLCAGCGVHAVLAACAARRVIGVDLNPRAVAFARLNAALNGVADRCDFRAGDLHAALGAGDAPRGFDLVLANPPFTPSGGERPLLYRDGGARGEDVLARAVSGLAARLARDGTAVLVAAFVEGGKADLEARLGRWLGAPFAGVLFAFDAIAAGEYALLVRHTFGETLESFRARYAAKLAALEAAGIAGFTPGVVALRRRAGRSGRGGRGLSLRRLTTAPPIAPDPAAVGRAFDALDVADDALLARRPRLAEGAVLVTLSEPAPGPGSAVRPVAHRLRHDSWAGGEVDLPAPLFGLLSACDGRRTLADLLRAAGGGRGRDLLATIRDLCARGILIHRVSAARPDDPG